MGSGIALLLAVSVFFVFFCRSIGRPKIQRNGQSLRHAPDTLWFAGNGLVFLQARHKLFSWFTKCERQFGFETFEVSVPSLPPGVVINDPLNLEYVLKNEGVFSKGDFVKARSWDLFGSGIINADGALWKAQRKAGLHFLNNANLQFLTEVALPRYLRRAVKSLQDVAHDVVVDLENVFNELTTQLMGHMAYGMDMHADDPFSLAFDYASAATGNRFQNPLWSITELFFGLKFRRSVAVVKRFGRQIVANAVTSRAIEKPCEDLSQEDILSGSLINSLLDSIPDHEVVADAALNFLTAGRDTTGQTLTWTFYLLMRHPSVILKIRKEVDDLVNNAGENHVEGLSLPMIRPSSLPFTMAVLYESLRLYPPIPFEIRQCVESTTLPDGTFLPKNAVLVWCLWAMNRSELIWGADPQDFRPERWIDEGRLVNKSAFEFPVFNGGPRACLGKKMAESIAVMAIATLIWEFDFSAVDQKERISKNSLTLPMEDGLPCRVRKRKATV